MLDPTFSPPQPSDKDRFSPPHAKPATPPPRPISPSKHFPCLPQALRGQTQENLLAHIDGKESGSEHSSKAPTKRVSLPNKEAGKDSAKEAKEAGSGDGSGQEPGLSKSKSMP